MCRAVVGVWDGKLGETTLQHIFSSNLLRIRSFFSLCDAVLPEFGKDRRPDVSVDCLLCLVKHLLINEEMEFLCPPSHTAHLCVPCLGQDYIAKACHKNEMARFGFWEKNFLEDSESLIELLDFDFPDALILLSRFCGCVFLLGFFFRPCC